ncbi:MULTISPECIES: hypothetical protein [Vagococcus]|uniref:hypothetical protein n=1 Tax=Vagococcus TaxID=2737 RepID=UPI002FC9DB24
MISPRSERKHKLATSDIVVTIALIITTIFIIFSNQDLAMICLLLLIVVLPISCVLYWLDFRKQNKN